jgi:CRP/FNR family cyclic AMP-dependent transcriptional regulator
MVARTPAKESHMTRLPSGRYVAPGTPEKDLSDASTWTNVLAEVPIFTDLSGRHLKKVAGAGRMVRFHEGASIIRAGTPGDALYVLVDGDVSVQRPGLPSVSLGIGSFFGEMALFDDSPRSATVVAEGPAMCLVITRARLHKLLKSEPAIAIGLLKELARRLRVAQSVE